MKRHRIGGLIDLSEKTPYDITNNEKHIYYDAVLSNQTPRPLLCEFTENRLEHILDNPRDYHVCVIEAFIPLGELPLFFWPQSPRSFDVTLSLNGNDYHTQCAFVAADNDPLQPVQFYQQGLDSFNNALQNSFNNLNAAFPLPVGAKAPFFTYDPVSQLFSLNADYSIYAPGNGSLGVEIWLNSQLYQLFSTLYAFHQGDGRADFKDYQIIVKHTGNNKGTLTNLENTTSNAPANSTMCEMRTELESLFAWDQVLKVRVAATSLNLSQRYILSSDGTNEKQPVLIEYTLAKDGVNRTVNVIHYKPSAEFEYIDLEGSTPLNRLDIKVYWISKSGDIYPIYIPAFEFFSIRLLFQNRNKT